jgi:hypothetical protein
LLKISQDQAKRHALFVHQPTKETDAPPDPCFWSDRTARPLLAMRRWLPLRRAARCWTAQAANPPRCFQRWTAFLYTLNAGTA